MAVTPDTVLPPKPLTLFTLMCLIGQKGESILPAGRFICHHLSGGFNLITVSSVCLVSCLKFIVFLYLDSFSAFSSAELMSSFFSSSTKSPFWCIWSRMSQPPTNSPLKYT